MKSLFPFLLVLLAGCRNYAPVTPLPVPTAAPRAVAPAVSTAPTRPVTMVGDPRSRQQAQLIEALISQNDALAAQLAARPNAPAVRPVMVHEPAAVPAVPPPAVDDALAPNADGLIDLVVIDDDGPVNPFAVRRASDDQTRELSLKVGGIIQGVTPCAVINDRLLQTGDRIEVFIVEAITARAVLVRYGAHRLRLPVSPIPTRVRLPL